MFVLSWKLLLLCLRFVSAEDCFNLRAYYFVGLQRRAEGGGGGQQSTCPPLNFCPHLKDFELLSFMSRSEWFMNVS